MVFSLAQILACRGLFPPQPCEPNLERFERLHQWLYLPKLAALGGIIAVQNAEFGLLLRHRLLGRDVHEIEIPFALDLVAKSISLDKVIAGFQKQDRNLRKALSQQV